jgi:hypothetical protein
MPQWYALQQIGVADGSKIPALRADGRQVNAHVKTIVAQKNPGEVWASGDQVYLGRVPQGQHIRRIWGTSDTTLGTATLSIGTLALPAKYVNGKVLTAVDLPTVLGPLTAAANAGPLAAPDDLWMTLGVAGVAGAINLVIDIELAALA